MSYLKLSLSEGEVTLCPQADTEGLQIKVCSDIAWRPEMPYLTIQGMKTMHCLPQLDRKLLRYAISWIVAIATSTFGIAAYV